MEAIMVPSSPDQFRNPRKKNTHPPVSSRPSENISGHVFYAPPHPSLSFSLLPSSSTSLSNSTVPLRRNHSPKMQPPLLPLPLSKPYQIPPPPRRSNARATVRDHQSLAPKKPKSSKSPAMAKSKYDLNLRSTAPPPPSSSSSDSEASFVGSIDRIGPDPTDLPKDVSWVSSTSLSSSGAAAVVVGMEETMFTPLSPPPPSSLPLPKFSVRTKQGCRAEGVAGVDAGATDDLRRLLRLR